MADDPTKTEDPAKGDPDPTPDPKNDLGDAGKKALEAERKARRDAETAKRDLEAKIKEYEDRDKSDGEKLADKIAAAEKRANDAEARALRLEIASAKGLTPAQAKRLVGSTQEELEADADEILEAFPANGGAKPPPSQKPNPDLKGGTDPSDEPVDVKSIVDSIPSTY